MTGVPSGEPLTLREGLEAVPGGASVADAGVGVGSSTGAGVASALATTLNISFLRWFGSSCDGILVVSALGPTCGIGMLPVPDGSGGSGFSIGCVS